MPVNEDGQMIGESMEGYKPGELPSIDFLEGRYARVEAFSIEKHAEDLLAVYGLDIPWEMWPHLFQEPVVDMEELVAVLNQMLVRKDRFYYTIIDRATGKVLGISSLLRIDQNNRVIEVGAVTFAPVLKGPRLTIYWLAMCLRSSTIVAMNGNATLLIYHPDELRSVWVLSMSQAVIYKGRTRDTDWLSMIDKGWPKVKDRFGEWLRPENFDKKGRQYKSLREL